MYDVDSADSEKEIQDIFIHQSTGYKFFLHSLTHIVAYIEDNCMILFDEPENHIHPPMLSFMMTILRTILTRKKSVMLVATHSPVVIQETFSSNVFIVRNNDNMHNIKHPQIETYGANIAEITREVFDLTTDITQYYNVFDNLYDLWNRENHWENIDDMLTTLKTKLINGLNTQVFFFCPITSDNDMKKFLESILENSLNDWRTVMIQGLIDCPDLDISVVRLYQSGNYKVNGIGV